MRLWQRRRVLPRAPSSEATERRPATQGMRDSIPATAEADAVGAERDIAPFGRPHGNRISRP